MKALRDGVVKESTDMILTAMRHGIIDPDFSTRELLMQYAERLEIAIIREKDDAATHGGMNGRRLEYVGSGRMRDSAKRNLVSAKTVVEYFNAMAERLELLEAA